MKKNIYLASITFCLLVLLSACRTKKINAPQSSPSLPAFFDTRPTHEQVSYIYAPGMMNSELGMGRYCPKFIASTGEKITWKSGGHVIGQPHSAVIFPEIDLRKPDYFSFNPITAFINSLRRDLAPLAQRLMQDSLNFTVQDNPESKTSVVNYSFNFSKANLGQKNDIRTFKKAYEAHLDTYPGTSVVLYGDSRGGATIFNFIALYNPTQVRAAVLDGIYDSLEHTVKHFAYTNKESHTEKRLHDIVCFFMGGYRKNGINQRECAEIITDTVPLLLVISLKDGLVAPQSAFYLYNRLRERGHQKVHLLVLKKSLHPAYMVDDPQDKILYETVVHAFYKHYNLPHNAALAAQGQQEFAATQPTADYLQQTYALPTCSFCDAAHAETVTMKKITRTKK